MQVLKRNRLRYSEMGLIRTPWAKQPQFPARIDLSNSVGASVIKAWIPAQGEKLLGSTTKQVNTKGVCATLLTGVNNAVEILASGLILPSAHCSILIGYRKTDSTNRASTAFGTYATEAAYRLQAHLPWSDGTIYWDFGGTTAGTSRLSVAGLSFSSYNNWALTVGNGRGMQIYQDGILRATQTGSAVRSVASNSFHAGWWVEAADNAEVSYLYIINRNITDVEAKSISDNPHQIFQPLSRPIVLGITAAAGGFKPYWAHRASGVIGSGVR